MDTPWDRDDLQLLVTAWRHVAMETAGHGAEELDSRIFLQFLLLDGGDSSREGAKIPSTAKTEKALVEHKNALIESFHFIVSFNKTPHNPSWFTLSDKQKMKAVEQLFTGSWFIHLDQELFAELDLVTTMTNAMSTKSAMPVTEPTSSLSSAINSMKAENATHGSAECKQSTVPDQLVKLQGTHQLVYRPYWTKAEFSHILQAWEEALDTALAPGKNALDLNLRVYNRFCDLLGSNTRRIQPAVQRKIKAFRKTYDIISRFRQEETENSLTADWFSLSRTEKAKYVKILNYKWHNYADIDADKFVTLKRIIAKERELADRDDPTQQPEALDSDDDDKYDFTTGRTKRGCKNWSREELLMLLRAWRITTESSPISGEMISEFDKRMFEQYRVLAGGKLKRRPHAMVNKKDALMHSYHFILEYNQNRIETSEDGTKSESDWFSLRKSEKRKIVAEKFAKFQFIYMDEEMFGELEILAGQEERSTMRKRVGGAWWSDDELLLLLRAWHGALIGPRNCSLKDSIYKCFVELCHGKEVRTAMAVAQKHNYVLESYEFISSYNLKNGRDAQSDEPNRDWFSLPKPKKREEVVKAQISWNHFVDLSEDIVHTIELILHCTQEPSNDQETVLAKLDELNSKKTDSTRAVSQSEGGINTAIYSDTNVKLPSLKEGDGERKNALAAVGDLRAEEGSVNGEALAEADCSGGKRSDSETESERYDSDGRSETEDESGDKEDDDISDSQIVDTEQDKVAVKVSSSKHVPVENILAIDDVAMLCQIPVQDFPERIPTANERAHVGDESAQEAQKVSSPNKNQGSDPEIIDVIEILDKQVHNLNAMMQNMLEDRDRKRKFRSEEIEAIKLKRLEMQEEWERQRRARLADQEKDRLFLRELFQ
ncbi:hypothetical protein FI667_g16460, partial [Globisporangium splendens]